MKNVKGIKSKLHDFLTNTKTKVGLVSNANHETRKI
jgi:hypothetical protein